MTDGGAHPCSESGGGVLLKVYLQPRASKCALGGLHGGELKVSVTAPPVDNAANEMLAAFIARKLHMSRTRVTIASGASSRHKTVYIAGARACDIMSIMTEQQ